MRRKDRFWPGQFDLSKLDRIRTVREFDEAYTAPYFGFNDAEDYYHRASAMRVVDRIRVPALVITAEDDPFVPAAAVPRSARLDRQPARHAVASARTADTAVSSAARLRGRRRLLGRGSDRGVRRLAGPGPPPERR